jgi:hypothetical protein
MCNTSLRWLGRGPPLAVGLVVAVSAGCTGTPSDLVSGWAHVSGTVARAADGAPVAGVTPSFEVFRDTSCTEPVLTTVDPVPGPPVTDAAGRYQTDLVVHAWGVFRGCLAVSGSGATVYVLANFGADPRGAPAIEVHVLAP